MRTDNLAIRGRWTKASPARAFRPTSSASSAARSGSSPTAIGDPNPIYRDPGYAAKTRLAGHPRAADAAAHLPVRAAKSREALKVKDWSYIVHGEQEFEYLAPVLAGDVLTAQDKHRQHHREGKPARRQAADRRDRDRRSTTSAARRCRSPAAPWSRPASASASDHDGPRFAQLKVGDAPAPLVCGPLTRTDFVRYAGASHDFNPNHHDEVYAQPAATRPCSAWACWPAAIARGC